MVVGQLGAAGMGPSSSVPNGWCTEARVNSRRSKKPLGGHIRSRSTRRLMLSQLRCVPRTKSSAARRTAGNSRSTSRVSALGIGAEVEAVARQHRLKRGRERAHAALDQRLERELGEHARDGGRVVRA